MMIQLDRSVPLPPARPRPRRYPWGKMAIGDSFVAEGVTRNAIRSAATYHENAKGWVFQVEPEGDGYRVFRTA